MKKQSKYWQKKQEHSKKPKKEKRWADIVGNEYGTKTEAKISSFILWFIAHLLNGFPVVLGKWFWYKGLALYPFIFFNSRHVTIKTITHERIHIEQQRELLVIFAYLWYLIEFIVRIIQYGNFYDAYRNISFEREAYENDTDEKYLFKRKRWAFIKYLKR